MSEAIAIRPSLGGSTFPKPPGIVKVKIDPESGELAGPNCPTALTVSVASWFAPRMECFKHMPETYFLEEASESDLEIPTETSDLTTESESLEKTSSEESFDLTAVPSQSVDNDLETQPRTVAKPINRRPAETELIEIPVGVAPGAIIERKTAKPTKPRP